VTAGPLRYRFVVRCPPDQAFRLWTARAAAWWPMATHSASGSRDAVLVIEPGAGGRVYERAPDGREFSWGTVLAWEPPGRLVCEWLVGDTATELEVRFAADGGGGTVVEIEHRGWERFGEAAGDRRDHNARGWSGVIPQFVTACAGSAAGTGA
jgi:uncharacterized protein YndB with AHSA1/START domain